MSLSNGRKPSCLALGIQRLSWRCVRRVYSASLNMIELVAQCGDLVWAEAVDELSKCLGGAWAHVSYAVAPNGTHGIRIVRARRLSRTSRRSFAREGPRSPVLAGAPVRQGQDGLATRVCRVVAETAGRAPV